MVIVTEAELRSGDQKPKGKAVDGPGIRLRQNEDICMNVSTMLKRGDQGDNGPARGSGIDVLIAASSDFGCRVYYDDEYDDYDDDDNDDEYCNDDERLLRLLRRTTTETTATTTAATTTRRIW